jgi:hypothetical protein
MEARIVNPPCKQAPFLGARSHGKRGIAQLIGWAMSAMR